MAFTAPGLESLLQTLLLIASACQIARSGGGFLLSVYPAGSKGKGGLFIETVCGRGLAAIRLRLALGFNEAFYLFDIFSRQSRDVYFDPVFHLSNIEHRGALSE